ncbi:DUF2189 domain-containing protein [Azorhizobium sp. AG788]|uniref:DUF2189 domain-containing protein n=1 Tax=Azorhizobium sp. AG788 TaxID=2183897 RepID=UPI0031388692
MPSIVPRTHPDARKTVAQKLDAPFLALPEGYVPVPAFRTLTWHDLTVALRAGVADFRAAPLYGLAFGAVYVVLGFGGLALALALNWDYLIFPALSGFLLFGPFAALGLYQISRCRMRGQAFRPMDIFLGAVRGGGLQMALFGFFLMFATIVWLKAATLIYALFFGLTPMPLSHLLEAVFTTAHGLRFAATGILAGAACASAVFATSVLAVPLLLDRDVDVVTAIVASIQAVRANGAVMLAWGLLVAVLIGGSVTLGLLGLLVTLPVVGHATWHLYIRALPPAAEA